MKDLSTFLEGGQLLTGTIEYIPDNPSFRQLTTGGHAKVRWCRLKASNNTQENSPVKCTLLNKADVQNGDATIVYRTNGFTQQVVHQRSQTVIYDRSLFYA